MTTEQKDKLETLGVNLEETLERFVDNEALYFKCLNKLLDDKNYGEMISSIQNGDHASAFEAAHALKGVSANLGLNILYKEMRIITEVFRAGNLDFDSDNLKRIETAYNDVINTIKSL